MEREPRDGGRAGEETKVAPEERPVGVVSEKARGARRKDAEDVGWMSMIDGDPALFIKGSE